MRGILRLLKKDLVSNTALSSAAPQQFFINDGDYMTDEKTQQPNRFASDLNAELGVGCDFGIGGTLNAELKRTAEMLVEITEKQGVYFAIALLHDASYDHKRIKNYYLFLKKKKAQ
jgi:hypothetical protein